LRETNIVLVASLKVYKVLQPMVLESKII